MVLVVAVAVDVGIVDTAVDCVGCVELAVEASCDDGTNANCWDVSLLPCTAVISF